MPPPAQEDEEEEQQEEEHDHRGVAAADGDVVRAGRGSTVCPPQWLAFWHGHWPLSPTRRGIQAAGLILTNCLK